MPVDNKAICVTVNRVVLEQFEKLRINKSEFIEEAMRKEVVTQLGLKETGSPLPICDLCHIEQLEKNVRNLYGWKVCEVCWTSRDPAELGKLAKTPKTEEKVEEKDQK